MKVGAFADTTKKVKSTEPTLILPNNIPFGKLLSEKSMTDESTKMNNGPSKTTCNNEEDQNGNSPKDGRTEVIMVSTNDDFIMVDLVNFNLLQCCMFFYFKIQNFTITVN